MAILTIIAFFVMMWGYGFALSFFTKNAENALERNIMRIGIGLGLFVLLGALLHALHIPLDWKIFLGLALLLPAVMLFRKWGALKEASWKLSFTKEDAYTVIVLLLFFFSLYMYAGGAFAYPYLEDDDPWAYATAASYVATEKTAADPPGYNFRYIDPYPPGYTILMGIFHQLTPSLSWTLKFFNALIISLAGLFFYFFAKSFMKSQQGALFSTFVLVSLPSFFTHFIWSHTLTVMLLFPALYCLEKCEADKKWAYAGAVLIAAILLTQPSTGLKIGIMLFLYFAVKSLYYGKFQKEIFFAQAGGVLLSMVWWHQRAAELLQRHASKILASPKYAALAQEASTGLLGKIKAFFPYSQGTATRAYTFNDFFVAQKFGMINVHVGWGIVVSVLLVLALIYIILRYKNILLKKEQYWVGVALAWLAFTFLGVNSMTFSLPVGLYAFRFWLLLAIPVALLSWIGMKFILAINKKLNAHIPALILLALVVVGIVLTSTAPKYNQNAKALWPPGAGWATNEEVQAYVYLKSLPVGTPVYSYAGKGEVIGVDKFSCVWCADHVEFRKNILDTNAQELHAWLKQRKYEYLIFEVSTINVIAAQNKTQEEAIAIVNQKLNEMLDSKLFAPVQNINNGGVVMKVV